MNRIFAALLALAVLGLVAFAVMVFTTGGPPVSAPTALEPAAPQTTTSTTTAAPPRQGAVSESDPAAGQDSLGVATPGSAPATPPELLDAAGRFEAWAKTLRDDGLTVTAGRVSDAGETVSVDDLTIAGPSAFPSWRWTAARASLYDRELFHFQAAGDTSFTLTTAPGQETTWSGTAEAIGVALMVNQGDVLARSVVLRVNGLELAGPGDAAPLTLSDGQLRILLRGGTGLLTEGTDIVLRLTDLVLPAAAGSALGPRIKSFTTEFTVDRPITDYALGQLRDFVSRPGQRGIELGTVAMDWGTLHAIGTGSFALSSAGVPRSRLDVRVTDPLTLLDALAAAGQLAGQALADQYAALLLELGRTPGDPAVPMTLVFDGGAMRLEHPSGNLVLDPFAAGATPQPEQPDTAPPAPTALP